MPIDAQYLPRASLHVHLPASIVRSTGITSLQAGGARVNHGNRETHLWVKKKKLVIFLKTWGLLLIFLIRSMSWQGGGKELVSPSPPAPVGGSICKTLPSRAQHTQDLKDPVSKDIRGERNENQ